VSGSRHPSRARRLRTTAETELNEAHASADYGVASESLSLLKEERSVKNLVIRFLREESGEDLIEYGLLCAFVAAVATAVIIADPLGIKTSLINAYKKAKTALDSA